MPSSPPRALSHRCRKLVRLADPNKRGRNVRHAVAFAVKPRRGLQVLSERAQATKRVTEELRLDEKATAADRGAKPECLPWPPPERVSGATAERVPRDKPFVRFRRNGLHLEANFTLTGLRDPG